MSTLVTSFQVTYLKPCVGAYVVFTSPPLLEPVVLKILLKRELCSSKDDVIIVSWIWTESIFPSLKEVCFYHKNVSPTWVLEEGHPTETKTFTCTENPSAARGVNFLCFRYTVVQLILWECSALETKSQSHLGKSDVIPENQPATPSCLFCFWIEGLNIIFLNMRN